MKGFLDLSSYAKSYFSFMDRSRLNGHFVNVSTITLICVLNVTQIDLQRFVCHFSDKDVYVKVPPSKTDNKKPKKTFYNQITLNYRDISNKSIKVFSNGKLQITGLTSFFECNLVLEKVVRWLNACFETTTIQSENAYVGMLNINFSVQTKIDLHQLNRILNSFDHVMAVYNPETYPAINVKLQDASEFTFSNSSISLFIFGTGNIVVTGSKTLNQSIFAYDFIVKVLSSNSSVIKSKNQRKMDDPNVYIDGYAARQYLSCIGE